MRKIIIVMFLAVYFLLAAKNTNAQVFNGDLTLNTQAEVDAFNYTEVTGILAIGGVFSGTITNLDGLSELTEVGLSLLLRRTNITNLNGLSNLTSVGAGSLVTNALSISDQVNLTNLDGLANLQSVGALRITDNPVLANIEGLANLSGAVGGITIENNDALLNLNGLSKVTSIGRDLSLEGNLLLQNIDGLSNVTVIFDRLWVKDNPALININGLAKVVQIGGFVNFLTNSSLENVDGLSSLTSVKGAFSIVQCGSLTNVDGLSKLVWVEYGFGLSLNHNLMNVDGLSSLTTVEENFTIDNNNNLTDLDGLSKLKTVGGDLEITGNDDLVDFCGLTTLFTTGSIGGTTSIINNGANTVLITPPPDIILNNDPGLCSKDISSVVPYNATVTGCLQPSLPSRSDYPPGSIFPVGTTNIIWTATDGAGNTATAIQKVIISDNEVPAFTQFPNDVTVQCAADVPAANIGSATATDNCPNVIVTHAGDAITNQTCANRYTLTRTYKATDESGNTAARFQTITVNDNIAPQITGFSASKQILAPPNHKMHDIMLEYEVTDNCNTSPAYSISISSNEPLNGTGDGDTDTDWEIIDEHHIRLRAERAATGTGRIYTITVTANDGCNSSVSATTEVRVTHNIIAPNSGKAFVVGSSVSLSGEFWDKPGSKHTAKWLIDGSTTAKASVTEPSGNKNGKITGNYKFNSPGVYKLQMNVTDQNGVTTYANTNGDVDAIVVIYDPNGGHTYGGGYFNSPAGALTSDASATGKASYGFAMNYFKNSTYPKGETQFEFKVGDFEFNALNFDYLVISNSMSQFKGTGKIAGGQSGIGFTMTVVDGQLDGTGIDKIRMKIYNKNTGEIVYDNQPGASDAALPIQAVGANSVIVIRGTNPAITKSNTNQQTERESAAEKTPADLDVIAYPNPTTSDFFVTVQANAKEKIVMQVVDMYGKVIETRNVTANSMVRFGGRYVAGTYFVRVMQGKEHRELKLIKF